jgi:hypothetical protein
MDRARMLMPFSPNSLVISASRPDLFSMKMEICFNKHAFHHSLP